MDLTQGDGEASETANFYSDPAKFFEMISKTNPNLPIPPSFPSAAQIKTKAAAYAEEIFSSWTTLGSILARREEVIRKRWMKKTKEQRKKVLLAAWLDMPERHRPDFHELEKKKGRVDAMDPSPFKWPYINQEDLLQGRALLLFLNARGRSLPMEFAHADLEAMHVGQVGKIIVPVFLNGYTMYIAGETKPASYGRLVSWDDDDDAFLLMHNCLQFQPGTGLLVLEIQSKVYSFLLKCCYELFHDVSRDELTSLQLPEQPEPPRIVPSDTSYAQLASLAAEAPYRLPAKLDTHRLILLVEARRAAAEDHVWDLREDPGYFAAVVINHSQHRQETLLDRNGRRHPHDRDELFWNRVIGTVIADAYIRFLSWDMLHNCVVKLDNELRDVGDLDHQEPLPGEVETALVELSFAAEMYAKAGIAVLKQVVPASPPIRERFQREPQQPRTTIMRVETKGGVGNDPLLRLFTMLWDDEQLFLLQLPNVVDELQRCIDNDAGQKARMSPLVADCFSDLALAAQLVRQVKTYYPWAAGLEEQMTPESRRPMYTRVTADIGVVHRTLHEDIFPNLVRIIVPLQKNLHYPIEKAYNTANVDLCRQAEAQLDRMWSVLDGHFDKHIKETIQDIFFQHGVSPRAIRRTPEWTPPIPRSQRVPQAAEALEGGVSRLTVDEDKPGRLKTTEVPRAKIKTRVNPQSAESTRGDVVVAEHPNENQQLYAAPTFILPRRAWKVFSTMFHMPSEKDHVGEINWADFLHAMTSIGFAAEKLHGSAWQFTPSKLDVENSIQIHEPHPSGKIPFVMARCLGKRFFRTYGLTGESFKLA